jgi:hypothetical protein
MTTEKSRSRLMPILVAVGIVIDLLLVGYVIYLLKTRMSPGAAHTGPTLLSPGPSVELWDAYEQAAEAVRQRAGDARLVSASAQWQWHTIGEEMLLSGASVWSFVFYSSGEQRVFDLVVDLEGVQMVNNVQVWTAPLLLEGEAWQTGPRDALAVFLAQGGREFLAEHPQSVIDLHLAQDEAGAVGWAIVALDPESAERNLFSLWIDAVSKSTHRDHQN